MGVATLSSRVLGFFREILLAQIFGASGLTDAFHIAFRIPNMLRDLFAEGAFSSAFVPTFTGAKNHSEEEAIKLLWTMGIVLLAITGCISVLIIIFAPEVVSLMTNELFTQDVARFEVSVLLTRIMAPFLTFVSLAALCMGVLNTYKMFFAPAMAPALFNVVMIISMLTLPKWLEGQGLNGIVALAIGVIIGGLCQLFIQIPMLGSKKLLRFVGVDFKSKNVTEVLHRMSIGTIGVAATQINLLVSTFLATGTVIGAVSWLQYSFRLFQFPVGILGVSIGNSNLVHFSDHWKKGERDEAVSCLQTSYITSLFTLLPAFALIYALAEDCVAISYQRGAFSTSDTMMVAQTLKFYLVGLPFYGLYKVFSPTFYTLDKPKLPVFISTGAILLNIIFCFSLVDSMGFKILALGTSLSMVFIILVQSIFLTRLLGLELSFFFPLRFFKLAFAGIICFVATNYFRNLFSIDIGNGTIKLLSIFLMSVGTGALAYFVSLCVMGDYKLVTGFFTKILKRK
ncbi:integral membrane protein MviN [Bacteriovorax sp. Seq25_V]|nr:integral membrane protein MviN [Bacteriovorax sp. Seq25_V]